jgi:hypothetical protein
MASIKYIKVFETQLIILLSYGSAANMITSQRCIGQTIANEENEAASLCTCIFAGA